MKKLLFLLLSVAMGTALISSCGSENDEIEDGGGSYIDVPEASADTWVSDNDIKDDDLLLLTDLYVKVEYMKLELVKMLSNNFEGDKLFCGDGKKSNYDPTVETFTRMMANQDKYLAAIDRLEASNLMKSTTRGYIGNLKTIFTAGGEEGKRAQEEIQNTLTQLSKAGLYDNQAQEQLYKLYVSQEPGNAKAIGAKDARDFFLKLNNGELNAYTVNISHIWRDKGILEDNSRAQDYAELAFTGNIEYGKSAYRVSSKVAVAAAEMYLTGIDKLAGGYGSKIIELGDAIKDKLEFLKLAGKTLQGKPDWQGWNSYIVGQISGDVKKAISDALGDDGGLTNDVLNDLTEYVCDDIAKKMTAEETANTDGTTEAGKQKLDKIAKADKSALIDIYTDFKANIKLVIVTDDKTGDPVLGKPNDQGVVTVSTTPGSKTITIIDADGKRLTKKYTAEEGYNTVTVKSPQKPYLTTNPDVLEIDGKGDYETATVLTNCKYVKYRVPKQEKWFSVALTTAGQSITLKVTATANDTGKDRSGSVVLEGYNDKGDDAKPVATYTVKFTQYAQLKEEAGVSPTKLTFKATGGTQRVTINMGDYNRGGYDVKDEDESWVSVTDMDIEYIDITVKENTTGKPRTSTVTVYMTNSEAAKPEMSDVVGFPISITQEAGETVPGVITMAKISSIAVTANAMMQETGKSTTAEKEYKQTFASPNIKFTQDQDIVHVTATNNYTDVDKSKKKNDEFLNSIAFDIVNFGGNFSDCSIEELQSSYVYNDLYIDYTTPGLYQKSDGVNISVTNVDWQAKQSTYLDGGNSHFVFGGNVANGVVFKSLTEKMINYSTESPTQNFVYVNNKNNSYTLVIEFEAAGETKSRMAAPWQNSTSNSNKGQIIWKN